MPKKIGYYNNKKEGSPSLTSVQNVPETIEKCGWLQKWTNYMKGYRQRWFVLDGNGNLSYYRNESEVGVSCRGSINLQEARIHSDPIADTLVISASSQSFHLKAQNDVDRSQWLHALEYSRHRVLKEQHADSDDENQNVRNKKKKSVRSPEQISTTLNEKMAEIRAVGEELNGHATELKRFLNDRSEEGQEYNKICNQLRHCINKLVKTSDELTGLATTDCRNLTKYASKEHEQKIQLREQLETLAHQHSRLEKVAFSNANKSGGVKVEQPPYIENDDEIFHDATDDLDEFKLTEQQERKSASSHSRQESVCDDQDAEIFNAEIVIDGGRTTMAEFNQIQDDNRAVENSKLVTTTAVSPYKKRRDCIPERPHGSISLWSIMRNCIGKELTKIPMPVNFNEPLSVCQRITEDLEYAYLLDRAAEKTDSCEQICYVAAYAVSCYSTTQNRTTKPFNPVLGETYECDRTEDLGWRSLTEQVSHHPPATAHHAEGQQWTMFQEITMTSRFRGKYLSVTPQGFTHVTFKNSGAHYTYRKITTTVHNIIVGKLWIDNHGEMVIENHKTGDKCILKFSAYSYFSSEKPRKVNGVVKDKQGVVRYIIQGFWDRHVDILQVSKHERGAKNVLETLTPRRVWTINPPYKNSDKMYFFTKLAIELNEEDESVAPTDSRRRPDQRLMEKGHWDEANRVKNEIEDKQRLARRKLEAEADKAMQAGIPFPEYKARWFEKSQDELTGSLIHLIKDAEYWKHKQNGDWKDCPDIF